MAVRALIVAIEKYPVASGLPNELPGTNVAATAFYKWLTVQKKVAPSNVFCCADKAAVPFATHGTTRPEIIQAVQDLETAGKDDTEELYCYFAGHGFCYPRDEVVQDDIFVASDFKTLKASGGACLKLRELMDLLAPALGPGDHYYFFDACRTEIKWGEIRPSDMGVTFDRSQLGFAGRAVLFSVEQGLAARVDSQFSTHLVNGLSGKGRAKGWYNDALYVKFEFLWKYVKAMMNRPVDWSIGQSEGLILAIEPVPSEPCAITVAGASSGDSFTYTVKQRNRVTAQGQFQGSSFVVTIDQPGDYQIELKHRNDTVLRVKPPGTSLVDLYEPAEVLFRKQRGAGLEMAHPKPPPTMGTLSVLGAPGAEIHVRELQGDLTLDEKAESVLAPLHAGDYQVVLEERGQVVASQTVTVKPGRRTDVDMAPPPTSPLQVAILGYVAPQGGRSVDFSESLGGPTADRDLGLWLSLLGASRIVGRQGEFSKLDRVPLPYRFSALPPGSAPLYVLAGFDGLPAGCAIGVGKDPKWADMTAVAGIDGLYEHFREDGPGSKLVTFQAKGRPPVTLSTYALPDRATFLVLTAGTGPAAIRLYQFLLPIGSLMHNLPDKIRRPVLDSPLKTVQFLAQVERLLAEERSINKAFGSYGGKGPDDPATFSEATYSDLLESESLLPFGSLIAANDLLRHGVLNTKSELYRKHGGALLKMVHNFREHFDGIPDVEALAKAIGQPYKVPIAPPLLADSVAAFSLDEQQKFMPFPNDRRHFGTPWVTWVNAVTSRYERLEP